MPRNHTNFPELDLDSSLTPEERDIIEKAEELIHDLTFLDSTDPENVLDWVYQFSYTTKSFKTRRGYNYILQTFESKNIPYNPNIFQVDKSNRNNFAIYIVSIVRSALIMNKAIPNGIESLIVEWRILHSNSVSFEFIEIQPHEEVLNFLKRIIETSEQNAKDVFAKIGHAIYYRDFHAATYHTQLEEITYIAGAIKTRLEAVPADYISLSSIKWLNFKKSEDTLDFLMRAIFLPGYILSPEWMSVILSEFEKNGYKVRTNLSSPPNEKDESEYARFIIEFCLLEIYTNRTITNVNNWFRYWVNRWKELYGTKEIWSRKKVEENSKKQIPKILRQTSDAIQEVMDDGEKWRLAKLIGYIRRK